MKILFLYMYISGEFSQKGDFIPQQEKATQDHQYQSENY
jgi:hypothetical protein